MVILTVAVIDQTAISSHLGALTKSRLCALSFAMSFMLSACSGAMNPLVEENGVLVLNH